MATRPMHQSSAPNPKLAFDAALALIQQGEAPSLSRQSAIARRQPIANPPNDHSAEKRALTDAARALAQLWKVSPNLVR